MSRLKEHLEEIIDRIIDLAPSENEADIRIKLKAPESETGRM